MDSAIYQGYRDPALLRQPDRQADRLGEDREDCLRRLDRALSELIVDGVDTTTALFRALLGAPDIRAGL
jgi:acetyl-CoA carboxylase biotin carboxylase subunit